MDDSTQPAMEPAQPAPPPSDQGAPPPPFAPQSAWTLPARAPLPGSVVGAAVVLLVMGVLTGLIAALVLLSSQLYDQMPSSTFSGLTPQEIEQLRTMSRGFATGFGVVAAVIALGHLAAGVGIFRRATWARIIGMLVAGLGILFTGLLAVLFLVVATGQLPFTTVSSSGLTPEQMEQAMRAGSIVAVVIFGVGLLAYLFSLVALIRNGRVFD